MRLALVPRRLAVVAAVVLFTSALSAQSVWVVDANATGPGNGTPAQPFTLVQDAIENPGTVDGDVIEVRPGLYNERVDFVGKSLELRSTDGPAVTILDSSGIFLPGQTVVKIQNVADARLTGLTIRGGAGTDTVDPGFGFSLFVGGGLLIEYSTVTIRDCRVVRNIAESGAGLYADTSVLDVADSRIEWNWGKRFGIGLRLHACTTTLRNVVVRRNRAFAGDGGGILATDGTLTLEGVLLDANQVANGGSGGNLYLAQGASTTVTGTTIGRGGGIDGDGGGVWIDGGTHVFRRVHVLNNFAGDTSSNREGGGMRVRDANMIITESTFEGNQSSRGGALRLEGSTARVEDTLFSRNTIRSGLDYGITEGGAIAARATELELVRCRFVDNEARNHAPFVSGALARGGALRCDAATTTVDQCVFVRNRAVYRNTLMAPKIGPAAVGGALSGPASVSRSIFWQNYATTTPDTFDGHTRGGAVHGAMPLDRCTLVANMVKGTGGTPDVGAAVVESQLVSSIVRGNLPPFVAPLGPGASATFSNVEGGTPGVGNLDLDPLFIDEACGDFHLQPLSPSIDTGDPRAPHDPDGTVVDQGALPFDPGYMPRSE